jgi:aryl-alcohol dehydrogenase (NADP+)
MDYVNLGKTGIKVSRLCLGMITYGSNAGREWALEADEIKGLEGPYRPQPVLGHQ